MTRGSARGLAVIVAVLCAPGVARAQFVTTGADLEAPSGDAVDETAYTGRVYTSGMYYTEAASATPAGSPLGQDVSPYALKFADIRAKLLAEHIQGGKWNAVGDLRVRYALPSDPAAGSARDTVPGTRGSYRGVNEYQLREGYFWRRAGKSDVAVGRQVIRDVDAVRVDGARVTFHKSPEIELGAFAGLYPNPFSRSLDTDYATDDAERRDITAMPVTGGAWVGYRYQRAYGAVGAAAIAYRDMDLTTDDPLRSFVTSQGYFRVKTGLDIYHYGVYDLTGQAPQQLMTLQVGAHWRPQPRLLVELGYSHLSTYAISIYLRELLEPDLGAPVAGTVSNNLVLARMASDEGRAGATYTMIEKRIDLWGMVRYRQRDAIDDGDMTLPAAIAALPAETLTDLSAGVRKRRAFGPWTVGANGTYLTGYRTDSYFLTALGGGTFLKDRLDVQLEATYVSFADKCPVAPAALDPTCTGNLTGSTIRGGAGATYRKDKRWMFIGNYQYALSSASSKNGAVTTARPDITGQTLFVRAQYSF